uniref:Uncharacterized protein n=1 Tax=Rhizophora mucronata TaxID=61149 RepID=A0A2P2QS59_RHIMU
MILQWKTGIVEQKSQKENLTMFSHFAEDYILLAS